LKLALHLIKGSKKGNKANIVFYQEKECIFYDFSPQRVRPFTRTDPEVGFKSPLMKRMSVVLPLPLGAQMRRNSPFEIARETTFKARVPSG
jgi:hypothetical protein